MYYELTIIRICRIYGLKLSLIFLMLSFLLLGNRHVLRRVCNYKWNNCKICLDLYINAGLCLILFYYLIIGKAKTKKIEERKCDLYVQTVTFWMKAFRKTYVRSSSVLVAYKNFGCIVDIFILNSENFVFNTVFKKFIVNYKLKTVLPSTVLLKVVKHPVPTLFIHYIFNF